MKFGCAFIKLAPESSVRRGATPDAPGIARPGREAEGWRTGASWPPREGGLTAAPKNSYLLGKFLEARLCHLVNSLIQIILKKR